MDKHVKKERKMVVVKLVGGIGNQMFVAAYAKMLQMRGYNVCLDVETFFQYEQMGVAKSKKIILSDPDLEDFNIDIPVLKPGKSVYRYMMGVHKCKVIADFLEKSGLYHYYAWDTDDYFDKYMRDMVKMKDHSYVTGYFQNERFFKRYETEIRRIFTPKREVELPEELEKERNRDYPLVGIHFRRTDYRYEKNFDMIELEYYEKALAYMKEKIGKFDIFIISDDCNWVKKNWNLEGFKVFYANDYKKEKDYWDMLWMSKCDHNIIANSTFSWWGAWLNPNKDKIVIAPEKWVNYRKTAVVPKDWIQF